MIYQTNYRLGVRWLLSLLGGIVLASIFATGAVAGTSRSVAAPPSSPEMRAEAIAKPSVVYIETHWKGWVYVPANDFNLPEDLYGPFEATVACSGFVANSTGYVVTAGHCVDNQGPSGGKSALIATAVDQAVQAGVIKESQWQDAFDFVWANGRVEGNAGGSPPERSVQVFLPPAISGAGQASALTASAGLIANVVDFKNLEEGDVGLLKVNPTEPMPALQVAGSPPQSGTPVISAGYPGSFAGVVDATEQPSFKTGSVSSSQTVGGVPFIETNAENTAGMSGGPTFQQQGLVLGTVSFGPDGDGQAFNFISDTSVLKALLTRNGVSMSLSPADQAYRAGLSDYFAGRYHDAVAEFDKVLAVEPNQALAREYRTKAVANYPNESTGGTSPWLWVGIGVGIVLIGAGVAALLMTRRRHARPAPAAAVPGTVLPSPPPASAAEAATGMTTPTAPAAAVATQAPPVPPVPPGEKPVPPGQKEEGEAARTAAAEKTPPAAGPRPTPIPSAREPSAQAPPAGIPLSEALSAPDEGPSHDSGKTSRFCPECGIRHATDARFCESCGHRFELSGAG